MPLPFLRLTVLALLVPGFARFLVPLLSSRQRLLQHGLLFRCVFRERGYFRRLTLLWLYCLLVRPQLRAPQLGLNPSLLQGPHLQLPPIPTPALPSPPHKWTRFGLLSSISRNPKGHLQLAQSLPTLKVAPVLPMPPPLLMVRGHCLACPPLIRGKGALRSQALQLAPTLRSRSPVRWPFLSQSVYPGPNLFCPMFRLLCFVEA